MVSTWQDRRNKINRDHRSDFSLGRILEATGPDAARIVDENVEAAELLQRRPERGATSDACRDICGDAVDVAAKRAKLIDRRGDDVGPAPGNERPRARFEHRLRGRQADAARSSGDENTLRGRPVAREGAGATINRRPTSRNIT
jgi:hypothetical protein